MKSFRTAALQQNLALPAETTRTCGSASSVAAGTGSFRISLLTGGGDKPYAVGLSSSLASQRVVLDFIGSDDLDCSALRSLPGLRFLNLRGNQRTDAPPFQKVARVFIYYWRLIRYAAKTESRVFHILWNNKFEVFDRTLLMLYYRLLGKRIVLTAHNVNTRQRDCCDSWLNRLSLKAQYALAHFIFVHTEQMKRQLRTDFRVSDKKVIVIPFGINDTLPNTGLTREEARQRLHLPSKDRVLLFFGSIAPYKGLEYLVSAFAQLARHCPDYPF